MKKRYTLITLFILLLFTLQGLVAQKTTSKIAPIAKTSIVRLPPAQVRTMAEWEEVAALAISWESDEEILLEIVRHAVEECKVYIFTHPANESGVRNQILSAGIFKPDSIEIIPYHTDRVWMRDYGPWSVYHDDVETLAFSDFLYNRFDRHRDDLVPHALANYLDIPLYNADENPFQWVHTGGNFLRDGMGTAYSSDLILRENSGKTGLEIEGFASTFFGINDYRFLHRLPYDTIHHLDMHIRTLDEETLAVGWYPEGVADGPQIEANLDYIQQHFRTPFGNPYHIIRQEMPPQFGHFPPAADYRTYTNGLFINNTFLLPFYGESFDPNAQASDSAALQIYQEYLPGYKVVGINCNDIIPKLGALHCITKLVGVQNPLRISHPRLRDTYQTQEDYPVDAWVQHISGIDSVFLHYRLSESTTYEYDSVAMVQDIMDQDHWQASIPAQDANSEIQYYISAYATSGKKQVRPLPAPEAYYPFRVKAYEQAPVTRWLQTIQSAAPEMHIQFTDNSDFGLTSVEWSFPGGVPSSSSAKDVFVHYTEAGHYPVQLITENPIGRDTLLLENAVNIKPTSTPFIDDFETGISSRWETEGLIDWELWSDNNCHQKCLRLSHQLSPDDLNRSYLKTALDLNSLAFSGLTFDVAYALRDSAYFDELRVNLTDENGKINNIFNKGGPILATVDELIPNFEPSTCQQWRSETIDLREWEGQQVLLEFESIGDQGNNIYIDNIAFRANALPDVVITHPIDGTFYTGNNQPIFDTIKVDAIDPDGSIEKVSFYVNSQFQGDDFEFPYEHIFEMPSYDQYCYQAKAKDDEGLQVWAQQVCVQYDESTAIETLTTKGVNLQISPNPVENKLGLKINSQKRFSDVLISILDVQGNIIKQQKIELFEGHFQYFFNVEDLPVGSYFLRTESIELNYTLPFIKQ